MRKNGHFSVIICKYCLPGFKFGYQKRPLFCHGYSLNFKLTRAPSEIASQYSLNAKLTQITLRQKLLRNFLLSLRSNTIMAVFFYMSNWSNLAKYRNIDVVFMY
jgi:hypothetical protein